ncbi:hypothetical protein Tco_1562024 [Tanacetum coccineum]
MPRCSTLKTTISLGSCPIALLSISNICVISTPAIASKMPYFVALVALLGARAIVVKMALGALRQRSPIRLLFACTDNANITRNRSKPGKHGHETEKSVQKPGI